MKNGLSFIATGYFHLRFDRSENAEVMRFDIFPANVRITRNGINVQLEGISARLLDLPRVSQPAAKRAAVEAPDDWDIEPPLSPGKCARGTLPAQP